MWQHLAACIPYGPPPIYFVAVAEERHLGRATERLHLSQPPFTRQIKALEAEVGAQFRERTPRGMVLTHAGETLLRDAKAIFGMADQAADRAHRAGRGKLGRLDVGVYGSVIFDIVPSILARFSRENPGVEIALCNAMSSCWKMAYSSSCQQLK